MAEREILNHARNEQPINEPLQPDPYLREGPVRPWTKWVVGIFVVCLVVFVLYALNASGPEPQPGGAVQHITSSPGPAPSATTGSGSK
jgi:hypothetical protein